MLLRLYFFSTIWMRSQVNIFDFHINWYVITGEKNSKNRNFDFPYFFSSFFDFFNDFSCGFSGNSPKFGSQNPVRGKNHEKHHEKIRKLIFWIFFARNRLWLGTYTEYSVLGSKINNSKKIQPDGEFFNRWFSKSQISYDGEVTIGWESRNFRIFPKSVRFELHRSPSSRGVRSSD